MGRPAWRRTKWLIDTDIQIKLGLKFVFVLGGYLAVFYVVVLLDPLLVLFGAAGEGANWYAAHEQVRHFLSYTLPPMLFALACMVLHAAIMFHRLAGPVLRLRRGFESLAARDVTRSITLRKGDLLQGLAEAHNRAIERIREDLASLDHEIEAARRRDCTGAQLEEHLLRMEEILSGWKTDAGASNAPIEASAPVWA